MSSTISWKIFARLSRRINRADDLATPAFNAQASPGLYSQFSLPLSHAYIPLAIVPAATYFHAVTNFFADRDDPTFAGKLPYEVDLPGLGKCRLYLVIRLYPPNIVCLTIRVATDVNLSIPDDLSRLLALRSLNPHIHDLANLTVGILDSASHKEPCMTITFQSFPGFQLCPVTTASEMEPFVSANQPAIVGLLLGIRRSESMDPLLIERTWSQNTELNIKDRSEQLLINKQGIVFLAAGKNSGRGSRASPFRFNRAMDLVEIARVFQMFLEDFPLNRHGQEDFVDYIYGRIRTWLHFPDAILSQSYTNRLAWDSLVRSFRLDTKLQMSEQENHQMLQKLPEKQTVFAQISDRWWESPDFAAGFDTSAFGASQLLSRISDQSLRLSILEDLREAEACLSGKNYKAAVVMAGASVEAILLALLEQETTENPAQLRRGGLQDYTTLAKNYSLVPDRAMLELLDNSLRTWRNYIHPGRALRTGVNLNASHAKIVVEAARALAASL